jgi:hypothetical protein
MPKPTTVQKPRPGSPEQKTISSDTLTVLSVNTKQNYGKHSRNRKRQSQQ